MSVSRGYAQIGLARNFVVKAAEANSSAYGDLFLSSDFDAWYALHTADVTKLSPTHYFVADAAFHSVVSGSDPLNADQKVFLQNFDSATLIDMGAEIIIGNIGTPRMLVFRKIKLPADTASYGTGMVGYVVVENNGSDMTRPRFRVAVARA